MSGVKALDKLRESSHMDDSKWTLKNGDVVFVFGCAPDDPNAVNWGEQWRRIADEIEQEIAELQESWAQEAREHADDSARLAELAHENSELKREIAERYIELPLDADGVPIHLGDYLKSEEYDGRQFPCRGLNVEVCNSGKRWTVCIDYDSYSGTSEYTPANRCHHVKPRTIEDVLLDVIEHAACPSNNWLEIIAKYAEEIRGMMSWATITS